MATAASAGRSTAAAEAVLARSLSRYGQIAPVVVCLREETPEIVDGFKRLAAARMLPRWAELTARLLVADERTAKAAIDGLKPTGRHTQELEEAWIVFALVREDGLTQVEAAEALDEALARAEREGLTHLDLLQLVIGGQAAQRREPSIARRIQNARFREPKTSSASTASNASRPRRPPACSTR